MASKAASGSLKGYDHQFVAQPHDDLLCLICLSVARDPQQIACCGKVYCRACLDEVKKDTNRCLQCKKKIESFEDKRSDRHIQSLKTKCDNTSNGCQWIGELRSLDEHLLSCDFTLLPCPNQCQEGEEILKLLRKDIDKHKKEECPRRQYKCPHCKETGEYKERTTTHLETCPKLEIPCPNGECGEMAQRCEMQQHRNACDFEMVPCKYANIGCETVVQRSSLNDHEEDSQLHLQLAIDTVLKQDTQIKSLTDTVQKQEYEMKDILAQRKISQAKAAPNPFKVGTAGDHKFRNRTGTNYKFKFIEFNRHKRTDNTFYTPPFYTSHGGYKMCIRVDANGNGDGRGSHISVYAYVMRGENDDHLPWPFTGTVTFELLNQLEDENHYSSAATFRRDNGASQRVTNGERAPDGLGRRRYSPHSSLGYNAARHCQYLKDDCLYFRVTVDAETTAKPWLI